MMAIAQKCGLRLSALPCESCPRLSGILYAAVFPLKIFNVFILFKAKNVGKSFKSLYLFWPFQPL